MMNWIKVFTCLLLIVVVGRAFANDASISEDVPQIKAYRINPHAPTIDGQLDDSIWISQKIQKVNTFTQKDPDEGEIATESTLVAVAYDEEALYVAFWCYDSEPDKIDKQMVRRDRSSLSDKVTVRVDPFHDHQSGNAFEVSAAGVQRDCRYFDENNLDMSWDAVWESGVQVHPWGWSAEMRIPFKSLRFSNKENQTWGIDFQRHINRKTENSVWAFIPREKGGFVSNFGHLVGIEGIESGKNIELLPYVVSSTETSPKTAGNPDGKDFAKNIGFDAKYALSSDLVLDATFNPDFGQVELDQPVLNLSSFETYFQEKRPFFLEGAELFRTPFTQFYSRRIGRSPRGWTDDPEFAYYRDYPKGTTILGAAKLTGKLSERTTIAFLNAVTQEEKAEYAAITNSSDTVYRENIVEPKANYTVFRIKQDILKNSTIGGMFTLASQEGFRPATTGGIDWRLSTNNNKWILSGQAVLSRNQYQQSGYGLELALQKASGKHVRGSIGTMIKSPELDLNSLGFLSRANSKHFWAWVQYRTNDTWWIIQDSYNNFNFYTSENFDGVRYSLGGNYNFHLVFTNNWTMGGGGSIQGEKYSDRETRGNGIWEWPVYPTYSWWCSINTDRRKKISFNFNPGGGQDRGGSWWASYFGVSMRPQPNMEFSTGANFSKTTNTTRWVTNEDDQSVFADLDKESISLRATASISANQNLSIQLSGVALISGLDYNDYRYYQGGNSYSDPVNGYNNDYNFSAMNSTFLIRWEYSPGSTVYLVWTRARSEVDTNANNLDYSRDIDRLFSAGAKNVFLIKTSYWINL